MRLKIMLTCAVVLAPVDAAFGQATMPVPYGGQTTPPVPMAPVDPADTPEEIAADAARDLKDSRFYNKPGATRAQYDADWQTCRLIARGSRTPAGTVPYYYNPAVISPVAAGVAGGIGGLIAGKIVEGQQRRANRRSCLLIKGWRLIEVPADEAAKVAAMTDAQRSAYMNTVVGAPAVNGVVTERTSFALPADPALPLDTPVAAPPTVWVGKKADPAAPFVLAPGEAAVVMAYRRPVKSAEGRAGLVQLARYDMAGRDLVYRPRNWKKVGDKTVYGVDARSQDRKLPYEVQVIRVTAGDYVVASTTSGATIATTSYCFGAPTFHVDAGEVAYLGDFIPFWNAQTQAGKVSTLAWTPRLEDTRAALATKQPALASAMTAAAYRNRATYACSAITMDRWDLPGVGELPDAAPVPPRETAAN